MTIVNQHADQRSRPRVSIAGQPRITDRHSGEIVGQLVNLSTDGLMIAGNNRIACHTVRQMRIPLMVAEQLVEITIGAECLWCEDTNGSGTYWSGFQIIAISAADLEILHAIVER